MKQQRIASANRKTLETDISAKWNIDGSGKFNIDSGIGFFNHMLEQLAQHSLADIDLKAKGDLHIDDHHTVEDCGYTLGEALAKALGDKRGIVRYASIDMVMDDALISAALDISGRPFLAWKVNFTAEKIGEFDTELVQEFFRSFCQSAKISMHFTSKAGINSHHICEACFKACAYVLKQATKIDEKAANIIGSTKGKL